MWLPDAPPVDVLHTLALAAMDAAKRAGADFADIRIGFSRTIDVPIYPYAPNVGFSLGYGIRASVDGTWSFQYGELLTLDAVTAAATSAVAGARIYAGVNRQLSSVSTRPPASAWAPAPVVTGAWQAPMAIDPFTVPIDDYHRVLETLVDTTATVTKNASIGTFALSWQSETRVFASTAGSLVTQTTLTGGPGTDGVVSLPENRFDVVSLDLPALGTSVGGFENALRPGWITYYMTGLDEAIRFRELPQRRFNDLGRFPVVFSGKAFGSLFGQTVNLAVDAERAAGLERSASGTTYLTPIDDVLGASEPQFSPLLTATSSRALPSSAAVGWDDEGVVPETYTFLDHGRVVDYHTTRETAPLLSKWYGARGRPIRSHGTVIASSPTNVPLGGSGHVTIAPATGHATVQELAKDMTHGFVIYDGGANADDGLSGGSFIGQLALEIRHGAPVARTWLSLQFVTKRALHTQLVALGDASTVRDNRSYTAKGVPWQRLAQPITAPAALIKDFDILMWDLTP